MAVYKDKWNGYKGQTWRVACYYTDWQGKRRKHDKRGFATKKEAQEYEREYLASRTKDINMSFDAFLDIYMRDVKPQMKLNSYSTKENIINTHIRPYFKNKNIWMFFDKIYKAGDSSEYLYKYASAQVQDKAGKENAQYYPDKLYSGWSYNRTYHIGIVNGDGFLLCGKRKN